MSRGSSTSIRLRSAIADALERTGEALRPHSVVVGERLQRLARDPEARLRARAVSMLPSASVPDSLVHAMYAEALRDPVNPAREAWIITAVEERCRDLPPRTRGC